MTRPPVTFSIWVPGVIDYTPTKPTGPPLRYAQLPAQVGGEGILSALVWPTVLYPVLSGQGALSAVAVGPTALSPALSSEGILAAAVNPMPISQRAANRFGFGALIAELSTPSDVPFAGDGALSATATGYP